ncbi:unnamed protein product [Darwinula stevensoni]|uniref:Uncharacterized protein n=1 Tax=Darwinula stevensoni TaxID=69355 RepID=A0A7R8X819_9CRUS|nr:unnamed protein product [Darwinula stevensoni]CAG0889679.1 unnamed protein product [Darwinula stevensoni]
MTLNRRACTQVLIVRRTDKTGSGRFQNFQSFRFRRRTRKPFLSAVVSPQKFSAMVNMKVAYGLGICQTGLTIICLALFRSKYLMADVLSYDQFATKPEPMALASDRTNLLIGTLIAFIIFTPALLICYALGQGDKDTPIAFAYEGIIHNDFVPESQAANGLICEEAPTDDRVKR